ncbi:MAG: CHAT domain-containing protein [Blastocatellia bacterium]|nr:CHAT domain-containing protein [Blastocatellia bacterium]
MTRTSGKHRFFFLFVVLCLPVLLHAQEPVPLEPGKAIEREITGGESHTYQIALTAGQFVCFRLDQRALDAALILSAPEGKQLAEMNLTGPGVQESLFLEAAVTGSYRLVVRGSGGAAVREGYRLETAVQATATALDRQRVTAQSLLLEANLLRAQEGKTAQQVIEKMQQARPLLGEIGEPGWTAYSLRLIGDAYAALSEYTKAIEYYEQALAICREFKDRSGEGNALNNLGITYNRLSQYEKAIEYYEQALAIRRELKDRSGEGNALNNLGITYYRLRRNEKAIEYFEQSLTIRRELKDRSREGYVLGGLGQAYNQLSQYEKAIEYFEQALTIRRELKDRRGEGNTLNGLGITYNRLSQYEKAIEYHEQALAILREVKDRGGEGTALLNLGAAYYVLNRWEKAIEYYEQALPIFREVKDRNGVITSLAYLGQAYNQLRQYEKAIEYYEQALAIQREAKDRRGEAEGLNNLGVAYSMQSRNEKAIHYYEQSLAIRRELKDRSGERVVLSNLGIVYYKLNQYEKSIEYKEQALTLARENKVRWSEANELSGLGLAARSLGRFAEATRAHEQAVRIAREIKAQSEEASALHALMLDWKARNLASLAIYFGKQSVNLLQEIRANIRTLDSETQQSFLKDKEPLYRDLADLLIAQGRLPEAEQVIRMLKEEEYFEYIRRDEANSPKAEKAALTPEEAAFDKRYREVADKLTEIGTERSSLLDKKARTPEDEQRLAKLEADLVVAGQAFQKFLDGLAAEMSKNADTNARAFQLRESQGLMEDLRELGKGVVALYTLVGEDKYRVILTTADFQKGYEYPIKAEELNRKVLAFRDVLQNPKLDPLPLAQELYKVLVGPVAKDLQGTKAQMVMWSLDGVLRYLPVAALHDGKQYLVERYRTAVFTPASQSRLRVEPSRKWTALGLGVTKAHGPAIPALPGVLDEMRGIIQETGAKTGVLPGSIKLDEAFTQEAMLTELRKRNPVVHIASHFKFQPGNETNSALLLGDGQFLSLAQIKSLPNVFAGVDLLTLSACNTATGGAANGKEVEGFGVLAQRQGAKAVVASLWPVADRSTKHLMQEFYRLREAKADVTKVEALRQAQIKLLRGELQLTGEALAAREIVHETAKAPTQPSFKPDPKAPYAHPYYWAPFILIGNWK